MKLVRRYYDDRTEGKFLFPDDSQVYCLERPWLNNKPFVSCIPEGSYIVKRDKTGRFQYYAFLDVKGRSHIEIHPANTVSQLQGCLAPCLKVLDGRAISSKLATTKLLDWFGDSSFVLEIRKYNPFKDGKW